MRIVRETKNTVSLSLKAETGRMSDAEAHFQMWTIYLSLIGEQRINPRTVRFWPETRKVVITFMSKRDCARFLADRRHFDVS